jgi:IS30 family transposase
LRINVALHEREEISRGLIAGLSLCLIAKQLGRAPSTVSREVARNGGQDKYRAVSADQRAWDQAIRPKQCVLETNKPLLNIVAEKLKDDWSPEQISGWLSAMYHDDKVMRISHETIYRSLFIQARGVLKKELISHLRSNESVMYYTQSRAAVPSSLHKRGITLT